jgi:hypothetical protein
MVPALEAAVEAAKQRHPSGKSTGAIPPPLAPEDVADSLTAADRCDRCSAGALYQLQHREKQQLELVLCHHHGQRFAPLMGDWTVIGQNLGLMKELYANNRLKGGDHA